jgi:Na+/melibiose symporter-like transporter
MWELAKLAWNFLLLRRSTRNGEMTWRVWVSAIAFVVLIYGIALPATLLYEKHPEDKPIFIAAMIAVGIIVVAYFWLAIRWRLRLRRANQQSAIVKGSSDNAT